MGRAYSDITFTPTVRDIQSRMGSRAQYEFLDDFEQRQDSLGRREIRFVEQRDHFFQATVNETGWPYVQHRGGPAGFLKVIDPKTLGFADFHGNVQYLSVGNLKMDDRISLILVDQAEQVRLKIIGRARTVEAADDPALIDSLRMPGYRASIERAFIITVEGYDWNCPQHITPRFTENEISIMSAPLHAQVKRLKEQVAQLSQAQAQAPQAVAPPSRLGDGPLPLVIAGVRQLTARVRAYELRRADGAPLPPVRAGAHLDVPVMLPEGGVATRRYSISSDPALSNSYEIAVLREDDGSGGSQAVHADFRLGLELNCSMPGNDFALAGDGSPSLLIAGGIGITPIKAMAHQLLAEGRDFELHYAARSWREAPFVDQLKAELGGRLVMHVADGGERLRINDIVLSADATTVIYACGPQRMIDAVRDAARTAGIEHERVRFERFSIDASRPDDKPVFLTLSRSGKVIEVPADVSILDAVQAAGVAAPASCRIGNCGTCAVDVLAGTPDHRDEALSEEERTQGRMCICVSRAQGDALTLDL